MKAQDHGILRTASAIHVVLHYRLEYQAARQLQKNVRFKRALCRFADKSGEEPGND